MHGTWPKPLLLLLVATAALLHLAGCAPASPAGQALDGPDGPVRPQDVPFIECQVCQLLAKNAWSQVKEMIQSSTAANPIDENKVIERIEKITTAWQPEGEWIARLDLVEDGDRLKVKEMGQVGNCGSECKTVQLAAERIMGEHDTDVGEILYTGRMNRPQFTRWLCWDESSACQKEPPPLPKDRPPGPPFDPRQEGDENIDEMLGSLAEETSQEL